MGFVVFRRIELFWPVLFFLIGFLYDILTLHRIDSLFLIFKQGFYLTFIGAALGLQLMERFGHFEPKGRIKTVWKYHEHIIHFMMGTLLSEYTLFFFKSASLWSSLVFMALLTVILLFNEFKELHGDTGVTLRILLYSICLVSFFICLSPVVLGFLGPVPFLVGLAFAWITLFFFVSKLKKRLPGPENAKVLRRKIAFPFNSVLGAFVALYFTHLIPPIPLAIKYIGVFHEIKKEPGKYFLGYTREWWRVWENGDQTFLARPGDRIYCFVQIFSPSRFKDQVQVRWLFKDSRHGWQKWDAIPLDISGGREEGYRGFTYKTNFAAGEWQIRIETRDGREVGRTYLTVLADVSQTPREVKYEEH